MTAYAADTEIAVPADQVWEALMDLPSWREWATFHPTAHGAIEAGQSITVRFSVRGLIRIPGRARFIRVEPGRSLWWRGGLGSLLAVEHGFDLTPTEGGTLLHHEERFSGPLAGLVVRILGSGQEGKYAEVNQRLKRRLEV